MPTCATKLENAFSVRSQAQEHKHRGIDSTRIRHSIRARQASVGVAAGGGGQRRGEGPPDGEGSALGTRGSAHSIVNVPQAAERLGRQSLRRVQLITAQDKPTGHRGIERGAGLLARGDVAGRHGSRRPPTSLPGRSPFPEHPPWSLGLRLCL